MDARQAHALNAGVIRRAEVGPASFGVAEQHRGVSAIRQDRRREQRAVAGRHRSRHRDAGRIQVGKEGRFRRHVSRAAGAVPGQAQHEAHRRR